MVKSMKCKSRKIKTRRRSRHGGMENVSVFNTNLCYNDIDNIRNRVYECRNSGLTKFPNDIPRETRIINLYGNKITKIPNSIRKFTHLRELNLNYNELTSVPPEIGKLSKLKILKLTKNNLTSIPPEIGNLTKLKTLELSSNKLTTIPPEIGNLSNLEELRLDNNQLTSIPDEIIKLDALKHLTIWKNPNLETIPRSIINLRRLNSNEGLIEFGNNKTDYKWLHDDIVNTYRTQLGKYPRPMPNQQWKTLINTQEFAKEQVPNSEPLIHEGLPISVDTHIMSFLQPEQQQAIMKSREQTKKNRNINTGGRKTRKNIIKNSIRRVH
jgi:Leucine-rich repeat (LRR) protein